MDPTWHGLRIGDWGTWLAGVATLLAVVVAIAVPWVLEHRRRKELARQAERSAHILAIEMYEPLRRLHDAMAACRSVLGQALEGQFNGNPAGLALQTQLWGTDELPKGADLCSLPFPLPPCIAALRSSIALYNSAQSQLMNLAAYFQMDGAINQLTLLSLLDGAQSALVRAAHHLARYEPGYRRVSFADRGDGTEVRRLEDYVEGA